MGRERQFINERLVTAGRFKPGLPAATGQGPTPVEPAAPTPAEEQAPAADSAAETMTPPVATAAGAPAPAPADLPQLLRREQAVLDKDLRREREEEFRRRREEVCTWLASRAAACDAAWRDADRAKQELRHWQERIAPVLELTPEKAADADLREARRRLEEVHLELLRRQRDGADRAERADPRSHPLTRDLLSLSFAQATRLGLGLLWPLAVAVLLAALLLAACFLVLFRAT